MFKDKSGKQLTNSEAIKKIFKRPHLNEPYASIRTDNGKEFKGVFSKWMYNESILHRIAEPYRHQQLANVENLNRTLGRLLMLFRLLYLLLVQNHIRLLLNQPRLINNYYLAWFQVEKVNQP